MDECYSAAGVWECSLGDFKGTIERIEPPQATLHVILVVLALAYAA